MKKLIIAMAAFGLSSVALAEGPSWTFVEASYIQGETGEYDDESADGYGIAAGMGFFDIWHASLDYDVTNYYDEDMTEYGLRVGIHPAITDTTDVYVEVGFGNLEVDYFDGEDQDFVSVGFGIRSMLSDNFELLLGTEVQYIDSFEYWGDDYDIDQITGVIGGRYAFTDLMSVGVDYRINGQSGFDRQQGDQIAIDFRLSFGDFL
jgi:hypothetical protein